MSSPIRIWTRLTAVSASLGAVSCNYALFGSLSSGILAKWPSHLNLLWLTIFETLATLH